MLRRARLEGLEPIQVHTRGAPIYSAGEQKAPAVQRLYRPAHKGSFRLEYIWLGNQNLWRIRHTRPESPQLDGRAGEKNHFGSFVRELWRPQTPSFMRIE